jgi:hypothetical protein
VGAHIIGNSTIVVIAKIIGVNNNPFLVMMKLSNLAIAIETCFKKRIMD